MCVCPRSFRPSVRPSVRCPGGRSGGVHLSLLSLFSAVARSHLFIVAGEACSRLETSIHCGLSSRTPQPPLSLHTFDTHCGTMKGAQIVVMSGLIFVSLTLLICACAIPYKIGDEETPKASWWPLFVLLFYAIAAIPHAFCPVMAGSDSDTAGAWLAFGDFLVALVATSVFGFPAVLYNGSAISLDAMLLSMASGIVAILTAWYVSKANQDEY